MAFLSLVAPPVLHLVGLLLVLVTLLSPVPFHSSSISLIYMTPVLASNNASSSDTLAASSSLLITNPSGASASNATNTALLDNTAKPDSFSAARSLYNIPDQASKASSLRNPAQAPSRPQKPGDSPSSAAVVSPAAVPNPSKDNPFPTTGLDAFPTRMRRRDAPLDSSMMSTSNVRFAVGFLGSCFTDQKGTNHCSPSSLQPTFNNTWLASTPGLGLDTSGMLARLHAEPALILVCLIVLTVCSGLQARRVHVDACKATCTPPSPRLLLLLRICTYIQDIASLVLFVVSIFLRIRVSHANDAFNTANAHHNLGHPALSNVGPLDSPLVLSATAGTAFSCICISAVVFYVLSRWERRRLRHETPIDGDNEPNLTPTRKWARILRAPLTEAFVHARPVTISAPMPVYTPDHVPTKHEAWMAMQGRKIRPYPDMP